MLDERWAYVPGTNGLLQVSDVGRVWQYNTQRRKWMDPKTPTILRHGYPTTVHQKKIYRVHYLMMISFIGPPPSPDHTVDHICKYDGDWQRERSDNRLENLRWATKAEQTKNRSKSGRRIDCTENTQTETVHEDEEFRMVEGVLVSQYGRTKNKSGVAYTPVPNKSMEYALVGKNRKTLHRLVAIGFPEICGIPTNGQTTVDHTDRDKSNNKATNLRWATMTEQQMNHDRKSGDDMIDALKEAVEVQAPNEDSWTMYQSCSAASRGIKQTHARYIAPQSMAQLIKKYPEGATIQLRQNAGWSFRKPRL